MIVKSLDQMRFYLSLYGEKEGTARELFERSHVNVSRGRLYEWKRLLIELNIFKVKSLQHRNGARDDIVFQVDHRELDRFFFADEETRVLYGRIHKVDVLPKIKPHDELEGE